MEFRQLTSTEERAAFIRRVEQARAARQADFRATSESHGANQERLDTARLYGLFRGRAAPCEAMIAGIAMHDLEAFPQSCREPDLSQFVPRTVVECSEHWSLSTGAGTLAWAGLAMPLRLLGVKAVLAYLAVGECDSEHAGFYSSMGFVPVGAMVEHPFVETHAGQHLHVQAVVAEGTALENGINTLADACIEVSQDARVFHLEPALLRPLLRRLSHRLHPVPTTRVPHSSVAPLPSNVDAD